MARELDRRIRAQSRADKALYLTSLLNQLDGPKKNWRTLKFLRQPFAPPSLKLRSATGVILPTEEHATRLAQYLHEEHWQPPPDHQALPPINFLVPPDRIPSDTEFTMDELEGAIVQISPDKSPGSDQIMGSVIKAFDAYSRQRLLQ
eukprot:999616-Amphidinium_carterae.1